MRRKPTIIAHRGGALIAPENTLYAFKKAMRQGFSHLECDVQLSKDRVPVVIHDNSVRRTTTSRIRREISEITYKELALLDAGSWFDKKLEGVSIPSLSDLVQVTRKQATLMIDIKEDTFMSGLLADAIKKTLDSLHLTNEEKGRILLGTYHVESYHTISKIMPEYPKIAIIKDDEEYEMYKRTKIERYALMFFYATKERIDRLHKKGKKIWVWTVDEPLEAKILYSYGVDGIITNNPKVIQESIERSVC